MSKNRAVRNEMFQIAGLCCLMLIVGMSAWMRRDSTIEHLLGTQMSEELVDRLSALVSNSPRDNAVLNLVLHETSDVRDIVSENVYDNTEGGTRFVYVMSEQSCYQALSTRMRNAEQFHKLIDGVARMDVIVYGKRGTLRRDLLLYKKMHSPSYNMYYWVVESDEDSLTANAIGVISDGRVVGRLREEWTWGGGLS